MQYIRKSKTYFKSAVGCSVAALASARVIVGPVAGIDSGPLLDSLAVTVGLALSLILARNTISLAALQGGSAT